MDANIFFGKIHSYIFHPGKMLLLLARKGLFWWMPDELFIRMIYRLRLKKKLMLDSPITFNEKIQWLKLYDHNPQYVQLVDKYRVREFIKKTIGGEYLIPLLGVWDSFDGIDFSKLPSRFVLKCTHDSGSVVICKEKSQLYVTQVRKKLNRCLKRNYYYSNREWPYKDVPPRIIAEEYLNDKTNEDLKDYKIMCFNGEPKLILVCSERQSKTGVKMDFFDVMWNRLPLKRPTHPNSIHPIKRPEALDMMLQHSRALSRDIPFVRVDFYECNKQPLFGEMTFYPASGMNSFEPDTYDHLFGDWLQLPNHEEKSFHKQTKNVV